MPRFSLIFILFFPPFLSFGQHKPDFMPEDITADPFGNARCYCIPGIRNKSAGKGLEISYSQNGSSTYRPEKTPMAAPYSATNRNEQFLMSIKAPLVNNTDFKMLVGAKFVRDQYHFKRVGNDYRPLFNQLDQHSLKNTSFDLIMIKPLNERHYGVVRLKYGFAGNFRGPFNFDKKNRVISMMAFFASKKDEDHEWGAGFTFLQSFRRTIILPVFVWNRNFSDKWGLESILPLNFFMRYNHTPRRLFLGGIEYMSQSYRVSFADALQGEQDYALNHSAIIASISAEQRLAGWLGMFVKVGFQKNFATDFRSKSTNTATFDAEPTDTPFFRVGLFVTKPK